MLVLLDTSEDLDVCEQELGCKVEQLLTPLNGFRLQRSVSPFAIDNGAFAGFKPKAFLSRLERVREHRERCMFVVAPDVVGSARRTLEVFEHWRPRLAGWPVALAAQDGQENLPIPWNAITTIFIGGTTDWKLSKAAEQIIRAAQALEKWVHVGRVNTPGRFEHFEKMGVDSIDGTGLSRFTHMRESIHRNATRPRLFADTHA